LSITEQRRGSASILDLDGDLNEEGCQVLRKTLARLLNEKRYWLILNLEKVSFLGSHALGILLFFDGQARQGAGRLKLLKVQPMARMVLQNTRTKFLLEVFESEDSAVASF